MEPCSVAELVLYLKGPGKAQGGASDHIIDLNSLYSLLQTFQVI